MPQEAFQAGPLGTVQATCAVAAASSSVDVLRIAASVPVLAAYTGVASDIPAGSVASDST